jgi:hypothetical protein
MDDATSRGTATSTAAAGTVKTCPFCGAAPSLVPTNPDREGDAWGAVRCMNTLCPTYDDTRDRGVEIRDGCDISDERGTAAYIRLAVDRWNKRF